MRPKTSAGRDVGTRSLNGRGALSDDDYLTCQALAIAIDFLTAHPDYEDERNKMIELLSHITTPGDAANMRALPAFIRLGVRSDDEASPAYCEYMNQNFARFHKEQGGAIYSSDHTTENKR